VADLLISDHGVPVGVISEGPAAPVCPGCHEALEPDDDDSKAPWQLLEPRLFRRPFWQYYDELVTAAVYPAGGATD
jgi:hypothetical protein